MRWFRRRADTGTFDMVAAIRSITEATCELRVDVSEMESLINRLAAANEREEIALDVLTEYANGITLWTCGPSYIDLELLWGMCWMLSLADVSDDVVLLLTRSPGRGAPRPYGLWRQVRALDSRWPAHVPLHRRLHLLHSLLLRGLGDRMVLCSSREVIPSNDYQPSVPEVDFLEAVAAVREIDSGCSAHLRALASIEQALEARPEWEPWRS